MRGAAIGNRMSYRVVVAKCLSLRLEVVAAAVVA
jgi:hypothetical protein